MPEDGPEETSSGGEDEPPVSMANTKAEILDAALAAGLIDSIEDGEAMTKAELLALWEA